MKAFNSLVLGVALCVAPIVSAYAAETIEQPGEPSPFVLNGAQRFDLKSQINGRVYQIFISVPQATAPAEGFPVIYTTDGNAMFPQLAATANLLRMNNRAVIVGIGYPGEGQFDSERRYYDLTPKTSDEVMRASGRGGAGRETGGNDIFIEFIEKELKPLVERRAKINRQKQTLFGHSLGGLFTLHVLFNRPETFQNYVAAAPSVWWNNQSVLKEQEAFLAKYKNQKMALNVLVTANTDPTRRRPTPAQAEQNANTNLAEVRNMRQTAVENSDEVIGALKTLQGVNGEYKVFENETHISMVPASINSALRFVLGDSQRSQAAPPADAARGGAK